VLDLAYLYASARFHAYITDKSHTKNVMCFLDLTYATCMTTPLDEREEDGRKRERKGRPVSSTYALKPW